MGTRGSEQPEVARVAQAVLELWTLADEAVARTWVSDSDHRWGYIFPITFSQQVQHLFLGALDAADLSVHGLQWRPSPGALGLIRSLAESACVLAWMAEPDDPSERRGRGLGFLRSSLQRAHRLNQEAQAGETYERLAELHEIAAAIVGALDRLVEIVEEDRVRVFGPPGRRELFDRYFPEGYHTFGALSEVGSHPGFMSLVALFFEGGSIDFNPQASPQLRAYWIGVAGQALMYAIGATGRCLGWTHEVSAAFIPKFEEVSALAKESFEALRDARDG